MQRQDDDTDTVHAAAIVLAAAARSSSTGLLRHQQQLELDDHASCAAPKKTRWWSRLKAKLKWFRPHGHPQRIADAEPTGTPCAAEQQAAGSSSIHHYARHAPQPAVAFVAPPSSPASSVLTSESPSPVVLRLNASNSSYNYYSSPTASIFAIGPYAREPQQLVSPPAFSASAGVTEPSTAPVTPPPESGGFHLLATTPSSPEVPFARFLWSSVVAADEHQRHGTGTPSESFLHSYQLQPGSPVLVSPGSTSSSPPPWIMQHQHWVTTHSHGGHVPIKDESDDDEAATGGAEFVFGSNAADAAAGERFAGGEVGAGGDATEQWPFMLAHPHS